MSNHPEYSNESQRLQSVSFSQGQTKIKPLFNKYLHLSTVFWFQQILSNAPVAVFFAALFTKIYDITIAPYLSMNIYIVSDKIT